MEAFESRSDQRSHWIAASPEAVFAAIASAERIARWWGPAGFTNTVHQFDFQLGGRWQLTMHGPDGQDYLNESRFTRIEPHRAVQIEHLGGHHFFLSIDLTAESGGTRVDWCQTFDSVEQFEAVSSIVRLANAQNLERLAAEVLRLVLG